MVELANLIAQYVRRPMAYMHMPVPIDRDDDAFYAPLQGLKLPPGTELYLVWCTPKTEWRARAGALRQPKNSCGTSVLSVNAVFRADGPRRLPSSSCAYTP